MFLSKKFLGTLSLNFSVINEWIIDSQLWLKANLMFFSVAHFHEQCFGLAAQTAPEPPLFCLFNDGHATFLDLTQLSAFTLYFLMCLCVADVSVCRLPVCHCFVWIETTPPHQAPPLKGIFIYYYYCFFVVCPFFLCSVMIKIWTIFLQ